MKIGGGSVNQGKMALSARGKMTFRVPGPSRLPATFLSAGGQGFACGNNWVHIPNMAFLEGVMMGARTQGKPIPPLAGKLPSQILAFGLGTFATGTVRGYARSVAILNRELTCRGAGG